MTSRLLRTTLAALLLAGTASAQTVLTEPFSYSTTTTFPPTGWGLQGFPGAVTWDESSLFVNSLSVLTGDAAAHGKSAPAPASDSALFTPAMDFTGLFVPQMTFDDELRDSQKLANHPSSTGDGASTVEVSTDGGATWTVEWTETSNVDGAFPGVLVDLSAYAGLPSIRLAFHYSGTEAHEWGVDSVLVENGTLPSSPVLSFSGPLVADGFVDVIASGMTSGSDVQFVVSTNGNAPVTVPGVGLLLVTPPVHISPLLPVGGSGAFGFTTRIPAALSGATLYGHAIEFESGGGVNISAPIAEPIS